MSKKYVYGIINERSKVTDDVIQGGRIIQVYKDDFTDERVLIIQTAFGTIYETFDKYFITDFNEISEVVKEINKQAQLYKERFDKAVVTAERCARYLSKQATNSEPNIKKCFEIQEQLEKANEVIDKLTPKIEILRQSLLNCYQVTKKM